MARLRLVNPCLGRLLYPWPDLTQQPTIGRRQRAMLRRHIRFRQTAPLTEAWDRQAGALRLLNQPPVRLQAPMQWQASPTDDPLWHFRLHSWEWAWSALLDMDSREEFLSLCHDWVERVPVGQQPAWQPYPTSRRLVVWSTAWHVLNGDASMAAAIAQHALYLADHLERDLDNNHVIANAKALAWVGLLFPGINGAQKWRVMGLDLLWRALAEQVREDGGHVENSSSYHLAVWLDGLEVALLCQVSGVEPPGGALGILERMGDYALALRRPDGCLPLLNDSIQDEPLPAASVFDLAASAFQRSEFAWATGRQRVDEPSTGSQALRESGYVVLRSGWKPTDTYLVFDAGDLGPLHCPGHGHADALSIELWARGERLIVDPGTYQYARGLWRDYFRSTAAHSTATVDGLDQSTFRGSFRVADVARARLLSVSLDGTKPHALGEHDGYSRLSDPVIHRRHVCLQSKDQVVIKDTFVGTATHSISLFFHLATCRVAKANGTRAQADYPGLTRLSLAFEDVGGTLAVEQGWTSHTWYRKQPTPVLIYSFAAHLPIQLTTILTIQ